jgi:NitT/TauT family transport system ATP-binding protein
MIAATPRARGAPREAMIRPATTPRSDLPDSPVALPNQPLLAVDGVTLQYKTRDHLVTATYRVSFQVYPADRFVLLGPSGCGKSTLLKGVAGFMTPVEGTISLEGRKVERPGPDRMMVFQEFDQLLPWKTVAQNVMFPMLTSGKYARREAEQRADAAIDKVNLTKFRDAFPHMLSGGMKQRVAIARALAMEPAILLMEEPFAALDALTRRKMQEELLRLWDDTRFTVLFVTHSIEEAIIVGSRILVLSPHPGRVKAEINSHEFGHDQQEGARFVELSRRIHDMLFAERVEDERPTTEATHG